MRQRRKKPSILPVVVPLGLLLLASGWLAREEFPYLLYARKATATVDAIVPTRTGRQGGRSGMRDEVIVTLEYHVRRADGSDWRGRDVFTNDLEPPTPGGTVPVEYLPGREGSLRVVGKGVKLMPALFAFCVLAFAAVGVVLAVERRGARPRRRPAPGDDGAGS